ncbi:serine carboxypeptidase-like 16 [Arachis stenosperma]|uniref:serine carboxypeptidase-like 16 n=1 Tax=Arachis stenosperma TaxID=217475 RepID=UPI0025AD66A2|nr:serine carboxypeptidase-like 16 [Arachis stenosperma]
MASSSIINWSYICQVMFFALSLFLQLLPSEIEGIGAKVESLLGYDGPLPFHLETGYIGLGDSDDDMQVFYYFIKSENDPKNDTLLLWLTGGPGCSSFSGLSFQIGDLQFATCLFKSIILQPFLHVEIRTTI